MNYKETRELIAAAKSRYNHQQSKIALQAKYAAQLVVVYNGGQWQITESLLAFVQSTKQETVILLDSYEKPVEVNVSEFAQIAGEKYTEVMSAWLAEYQELSRVR